MQANYVNNILALFDELRSFFTRDPIIKPFLGSKSIHRPILTPPLGNVRFPRLASTLFINYIIPELLIDLNM